MNTIMSSVIIVGTYAWEKKQLLPFSFSRRRVLWSQWIYMPHNVAVCYATTDVSITKPPKKRIIMQVLTFFSSRQHLSIFWLFLLLRIAAVSLFLSSFTPDSTGGSFQLETWDKPTPRYSSGIKQTQLVAMWWTQGSFWQWNGQTFLWRVSRNQKKD